MSILTNPREYKQDGKVKRKGVIDSFVAGAKVGARNYKDAGVSLERLAYKALDDKAAYDKATAEHKAIEQQNARLMQGTVGSIDDIRTDSIANMATDTAAFGANIGGQVVGAMTGIATVLGAKKLAGNAVKQAGKRLPSLATKSKVLRKAGKVIEKTGDAVANKGTAIVASGVGAATTSGQTVNTVLDEGGSAADAAKAGATTFALSTAANLVPARMMEKKAKSVLSGKHKTTKAQALKTAGIAAAVGGASEVGDELAQEAGRFVGTGNFDMDAKRLKDAFIAGAVADTAFHVAGEAAGAVITNEAKRVRQDAVKKLQRQLDTVDANKEDVVRLFDEMPTTDLKLTVAGLREQLADSTTPDKGFDIGMRLYAAEKKLAEKADADTQLDDAFNIIASASDIALGDKDNVPSFDVANPYSSLRDIQQDITPAAASYLYLNLGDGIEQGVKAATKLGIQVKNADVLKESGKELARGLDMRDINGGDKGWQPYFLRDVDAMTRVRGRSPYNDRKEWSNKFLTKLFDAASKTGHTLSLSRSNKSDSYYVTATSPSGDNHKIRVSSHDLPDYYRKSYKHDIRFMDDDAASRAINDIFVDAGSKTAVNATATQLTDAPEPVMRKFAADIDAAMKDAGISDVTSHTAIGRYGSDTENSSVYLADAPIDKAVEPVVKVAAKYNQDDVLLNRAAATLRDSDGRFVARPALTIKFKQPATQEDVDAMMSALDGVGVHGATLTKDADGNYVSASIVSYPELAARWEKDVRERILSGDTQGILRDDFAKYADGERRIKEVLGDKVATTLSAIDGVAVGHETYNAPSVEKTVDDRIVSHVRNQREMTAQRSNRKAASEPDIFVPSGEYPDHGDYGSIAGRMGEFVDRNTAEDLKLYKFPDEYIADTGGKEDWDAISDEVRAFLNKYGFEHDTFSYREGHFKAPLLKKHGYKQGKVWIYDPYDSSGAFNDPEYTKAWRITHEVAHGITEDFMQHKYGDSRRLGAIGRKVKYPLGDPAKGKTQWAEPLPVEKAIRAIEWEDVTFRVQRMLLEAEGIFISDADFNREYIVNITDAVHRVLTGYFGDPGDVGFKPDAVDPEVAYAAAISHIKNVAEVRDVGGGKVPVFKSHWRVSDERLRDAITLRTGAATNTGKKSIDALRKRIADTVGSKVLTTIEANVGSIGEYDTVTRTIRISAKQPLGVMIEAIDHEMFHAMQQQAMSPAELSVLRNAMQEGKPLYRRVIAELDRRGMVKAAEAARKSPDEAAAYAFQLYRAGNLRVTGVIARAWNKIATMLEAVWNFMRGKGFISADGIIRAAADGKFADRTFDNNNVLYDTALDAEAAVMLAEEHTRMYREYMAAAENGSTKHIPEEVLADYEAMLDKMGSKDLTPAEKWKLIASGGWRKILKGAIPSLKQGYIDRLQPFLELDRRLQGTAIKSHEAQTYMAATEAVHSAKIAYHVLEHGSVTVNEAGDIVPDGRHPGLYDLLAPVHDIQHVVFPYMVALRAKRLMDSGDYKDGGLFNAREVEAAIKVAETHPRFDEIKAAAEGWYNINNSLLDAAVKVGAITSDMRDVLSKHGDYIPFYREIDGHVAAPRSAKGADYAGGIAKLTNSKLRMNDILDNMHRNILGLSQLIGNTRAMTALEEAMIEIDEDTGLPLYKVQGMDGQHPISDEQMRVLEEQGVRVTPVYVDNAIWSRARVKGDGAAFANDIINGLKKEGFDVSSLNNKDKDALIKFKALLSPARPDVVSFMYKGRKVHRRVGDPELLCAIKGITPTRSNAWQWMKTVRNFFVRTVVSFPGFWVVNTIRDIMTAYAVTDIGLKPSDFAKAFISSVRKDLVYQEALLAGGLPTVGHASSVEQQVRSIETSAKIKYSQRITHNPLRMLLNFAEEGANVAENISRIAIYRRAKENGMSSRQAGFLARDLLDFSKHGDSDALLVMIDTIPFMNARIQGLSRLGTGAREHGKRLGAFVGVMMFMSFALAANNYRDERYKRLTDAEKDNYWHIMLPSDFGNISHIRIPKPFELGIAATLAERMAQAIFFDGSVQTVMQRMAYAGANTLSLVPVPQAVLPVAEAMTNTSTFTGKDIVPSYLEDLEPELQKLPSTSKLAEWIAYIASPLPDIHPLKVLKSPILVDHLIRGYFGTLGEIMKTLSNQATAQFSGTPTETLRLKEYDPVLGVTRLFGEAIVPSTMDVSMLYVMSGKVQILQRSLAVRKRTMSYQEYKEYYNAHSLELRYANKIKRVMRSVRLINKEITRAYANKAKLPPEKLRARIDGLLQKRADLAARLRPLHKIYSGDL